MSQIPFLLQLKSSLQASQVALAVNNPSSNAGDVSIAGSILGREDLPGAGHGNPPVSLPAESHRQRSLASCSL